MQGMTPEDVYELKWVAGPAVSPANGDAAFAVMRVDKESNDYHSDIWVAPADGSEPKQFTFEDKLNAVPRWSPDGTKIAFLSNRDGDQKQLYVVDVSGGEARKLTDLKESVESLGWSPDSTRIAFAARVRDEAYEEEDERKRAPRRITRLQFKLDNVGWTFDRRRHIFVVPADGSREPSQITSGDFEDGEFTWSPDGSKIAFASARSDDWDIHTITDIYVVDYTGGDPEMITAGDGSCNDPSWSPDGRTIAYYYFEGDIDFPRNSQVAVLEVETMQRRILTADLDRNCAPYPLIREPLWDGNDIIFSVEDSGNTHLYRVPGDGSGKPELIIGGELEISGYDVAGGAIATTRTTVTAPADLYIGDAPVTDFGSGFARGRQLSEAERFTATSKDGSEVEAWIMRPVGFDSARKYPVLLNIHGGPFTQYGNRFFDEFHVYTSAGYVVVFANPRGSSGYSEEWGRAIRGPSDGQGPGTGSVDYEDVMAAVDEALTKFSFCDAEKLGVMGGSYGGYMTSWIISHSNRFKAACSERAVNNFLTFYGSSDLGWMFKGEIGAYAFEDPDAYLKISPATYAADIDTPLLIIHSENDQRCDVEQAEHLFTTLRLLGREVELVRFPAGTHELSRSGPPAHRVMRFELILEWFDRHLKDGA